MKIGQVSTLLGVSEPTIKSWIERYSEQFSDGAKKGSGLQRVFTDQDILVLATIAHARNAGENFDHIGTRLKNNDLVDNPSAANFGVDTRMVPAAQVDTIIESSQQRLELERQLATISSELESISQERDRLLSALETERTEHRQQLVEKDQKIETLHQQIAELKERVGRAEMEAELRRKRRWF